MYLSTTLGQSPDAAARQAAEALFTKYESECKSIRVLKRLAKTKVGLMEEAILLERRIAELPRLFRDKAELDRRAALWPEKGRETPVLSDPVAERRRIEELERELERKKIRALSPRSYRKEIAKLLASLGYSPNYNLMDLDTELSKARCERSMNGLRWSMPCGGMEVDDPENISRQVADHYMQTVLGSALSNRRIGCSVFGRRGFCDVYFPGGITIRVSFSKVPYALIANRVAPIVGPPREYSYRCGSTPATLRKVNLKTVA